MASISGRNVNVKLLSFNSLQRRLACFKTCNSPTYIFYHSDLLGIQLVTSSQIIEWSVIQMVIWIPDYFSLLFDFFLVYYLTGDLNMGQFVHYFIAQ